MSRYDDLDSLLMDLEKERQYKEQIDMENLDHENTIKEQEEYLRHLEEVATSGTPEDNEWKTRFEIQKNHDLQLAEYKAVLEEELAEMEWKLHTGSYPEAMKFSLDLLSDLELVRLVKHMEKIKNEYYTSVCEADYKTEKEMKEFHHLDETRRHYKADLRFAVESMERPNMDDLLERQIACTPPLTLPAPYVRFADTQAMDDSVLSYRQRVSTVSSSRSKSLTNEYQRGSSKSPTRGKSRCKCNCERSKSRSKKREDTEDYTTAPESAEKLEDTEKASGEEASREDKDS